MPTYRYMPNSSMPENNSIFGIQVKGGDSFTLPIYLGTKQCLSLGLVFVSDSPYISPFLAILNKTGAKTTDAEEIIQIPESQYSFDINVVLLKEGVLKISFNGNTDSVIYVCEKGMTKVLRYTSGRTISHIAIKVDSAVSESVDYCVYIQRLENSGVPADMRGV